MHYIQGDNRNQTVLFPATLEEYVTEDNPVRFLDVFVDKLDLKALGFQRSVLHHTGPPRITQPCWSNSIFMVHCIAPVPAAVWKEHAIAMLK